MTVGTACNIPDCGQRRLRGYLFCWSHQMDLALVDLANGDISHAGILAEGGHGAYTRRSFGFESTEIILATGPKRGLIGSSKLPMELGAPFGDNMMTGTVGVLEAIRRTKGLAPFPFL